MASPISATTVVHHQTDDGEHWTVLTGATVIAYCATLDQAADLADTLNDGKEIGDEFEQTRPYMRPGRSLLATLKRHPCRGLEISSKRKPQR